MNICVFCSSNEGLAKEYYESGYEVGKLIAINGHNLVFGGYTKGIMGAVANGALENGGKVISVIPKILSNTRPNFIKGADVILTETMSSRKDKMMELSDAFISLPGGIGTLDEVFQVIAMNVVGECSKPVAFLIQGETQRALQYFLKQAVKEGFITKEKLATIGLCETPEELIAYIVNELGGLK